MHTANFPPGRALHHHQCHQQDQATSTSVLARRGEVIGGKFRLVREIGRGSFAEVWEARHVRTHERLAVKIIDMTPGPQTSSRTSAGPSRVTPTSAQMKDGARAGEGEGEGEHDQHQHQQSHQPQQSQQSHQPQQPQQSHHATNLAPNREVLFMRMTHDHPNITRLHRVVSTASHLYLFQDLANCDLYDLILEEWAAKGHGTEAVDERKARELFSQLVAAVRHMHHRGVAHRDIKAENCLISPKGCLLLTDFGFATQSRRCRVARGTLEYLAPEVLGGTDGAVGRGYDPFPTDVWSCGVALFCMLTGHHPFSGDTRAEVVRSIQRGHVVFPDGFPPLAKDLLQMIFDPNPETRPSLERVQAHPFLQSPSRR